MPLLGFCSLRVYQLLSQHVNVVTAKLNKTQEEMRIEQSILKAIVIQALAPIIFTLPTLFIFFIAILHGWDAPVDKLAIFSYGENLEYHYTTTYLCFSIVAAFLILDPYIILRVVKSYR